MLGSRDIGLRLPLIALLPMAGSVIAGEIRLADKGEVNCVIVVPAGWTNAPHQITESAR